MAVHQIRNVKNWNQEFVETDSRFKYSFVAEKEKLILLAQMARPSRVNRMPKVRAHGPTLFLYEILNPQFILKWGPLFCIFRTLTK